MAPKNMYQIVRRGRERWQRSEMEKLGVSEEDIELSFKEFRLSERDKIIEALKNSEVGTGIDEIRKKIK